MAPQCGCAKVVLLDREALQPGESCYAQLRMTEEIATKPGDRFVIRFFSPLETIGGGVVLDDCPRRHKRNDPHVLDILAIEEGGSGDQKLIQTVAEYGHGLPTLEKLAAQLNRDMEDLKEELDALCQGGKLLEPLPGRYLAGRVFDSSGTPAAGSWSSTTRQNPLHAGMKVAELRQKLFKATDQAVATPSWRSCALRAKSNGVADRYALADFKSI